MEERIRIERNGDCFKGVIKISDFEIEQDIMGLYDQLEKVNKLILQSKEELYIKKLLNENRKLNEENLNLREYVAIGKKAIPSEEIKDKTLVELCNMPTYEQLKERVAYLERSISRKEETIRNLQDELVETPKESELEEKIEYLKKKIANKDMWCQLIADLGFDYDGHNDVENLKLLIDKLVKYALYSRDDYDYEEWLSEDDE